MASAKKPGKLYYFRVPDEWTKEEKLEFLANNAQADNLASAFSATRRQAAGGRRQAASKPAPTTLSWKNLSPNSKHTWLRSDTEDEFAGYLPIGTKAAKKVSAVNPEVIFKTYSGGVVTRRDAWIYDFKLTSLAERMRQFVENYNLQVALYQQQANKPNIDIDAFVDYEKIKWDSALKSSLRRFNFGSFEIERIRVAHYRPFVAKLLYFDPLFVSAVCLQHNFFPTESSEKENQAISVTDKGSEKPFMVTITNQIPDCHIVAPGATAQTFPFYTYDADGSNRRENITDWALAQFRAHYADPSISKWDIFYYVYGLLHHPGYRERYALDLKRSLPRIPFAPAFCPYADAGRQLADLHLNYESADRYELAWHATRQPASYRVEKMLPKGKVAAADGDYKVYSALKYNDSLTLRGIPERAFAYRLGNRSALDWIVDQYRVKTDKRSGIKHDPNGYSEDPQYILKLIERVITVSLCTVDIVDKLATLPFREK
ncbi:MAG: helicase [Chloroflexi bacterium]|nr:helicase [Chloroflexota bacterium]